MDGYTTVRANGLDLAYRVLGDPGAPALVLLHGRGGESGNWDGVAEELAESRRVYAVDLRGHGRSSWPGTYSFELMRDDVRAFLGALGVERADVVGHSMGGAVAPAGADRGGGRGRLGDLRREARSPADSRSGHQRPSLSARRV
ncbi:alpha/beta fold hydrolase, partial [Streptomyces sp. GC420]|nr:alpha/beta fold hydrolase [Streptomyces sp. GC420]